MVRKIGGLRKGFEGAQDYDLVLRVLAKSDPSRIEHIPSLLYHWRRGTSQKSFSESHFDSCLLAARRAVQDYLDHEGEGATVVPNPFDSHYFRILRKVPKPEPLVSFIIPTKDRSELLSMCLDGLLHKTSYKNIEVILVDNNSSEPETFAFFKRYTQTYSNVRVIKYPGKFNFSAINNFAARYAKGQILAFLNNDIEVKDGGWLSELVSHAARPKIGAVGAKLYYPNGNIQHAGVVIGMGGVAGHSLHNHDSKNTGYFGQAVLTREVSAVTGACLLVSRKAFAKVGGFDEENLSVAFNDIDLCLKLRDAGYRNIWTPFAELIHHESASRGPENTPEKVARFKKEIEYMQKRWASILANDPFYNPNLSLGSQNWAIAAESRRLKPWAEFLND